jgi:Tfp pilus assembly protein PilF
MQIKITRLTIIFAVLTICLFVRVPMAMADDNNEQEQYDKAMKLIGKWEGRDNNREEARKIALKMLRDNPDSARAYTILGRATWWMGYINEDTHNQEKVKEAQTYYHKALEADPSFREAEYYLAVSHVTEGNYDQALSIAEKFKKEHPDWYRSYWLPIYVADKKGEYHKSLQLCLAFQERFKDDPELEDRVDGKLLNAYEGLGMLDEAEALYQKFVKENPNRAWTLGNYAAFLCDKKKDYDKAIEYAQKALAIMDYGVGRHTLALSAFCKSQELVKQDKLEEAEPYCLMAVENKPRFAQAWVGLTLINYSLAKQNNDLERMKKAHSAATKATQLGMKDQRWAFVMVQIVTDLTKMQNEAKQKQETQD